MPTLVAIDISADEATIVTAETARDAPIDVVSIATVPRSALETGEPQSAAAQGSAEADGESSVPEPPFAAELNGAGRLDLSELTGREFDESLAVAPGDQVLYKKLTLPFADRKKIDSVAPLQLQDVIPFDIQQFIIDNIVLGRRADGEYEILSTLSPQEHIAETLQRIHRLGADPVVLTTKASALGALAELAVPDREVPFGLLEFSAGRCSLAVFIDGSLCHLRELAVSQSGTDLQDLLADIQCSIASVEKLADQSLRTLYVLASSELLQLCREHLRTPVEMLDLTPYVRNHTSDSLPIDRYAWAIGLFARETVGSRQSTELVDFRKGAFAYKPAWGAFREALTQEMFYIVLAVTLAAGLVATSMYTSKRALAKVEGRIASVIKSAELEEPPPRLREVGYLEEQVAELEEQLRSMGSLASLSTLDSLKELSGAIGPDIDIEVDSMTIGFSRLLLRGSVADNPTVGRLEGALNKREKMFCAVKVDPTGREAGSSRVKFTAEIELCD